MMDIVTAPIFLTMIYLKIEEQTKNTIKAFKNWNEEIRNSKVIYITNVYTEGINNKKRLKRQIQK